MSQHQDAYAPDHVSGQNKSSSAGCFFWGCLIVVLLLIVGAVALGLGGYWLFTSYTVQLEKYTSETPAEIPTVEMSEEEMQKLHERIESFKSTVQQGETATPAGQGEPGEQEPTGEAANESGGQADGQAEGQADGAAAKPPSELVLTADEINALIAEQKELRGRAHVRIEEGTIRGEVSIPTDMLPRGEGRYFNASAIFDVSMEDGILIVRITDATVKGEPVPGPILEAFRQQNLARDLYQDPKNARLLRKFESVSVEDDQIVMKLRQDALPQAAEESTSVAPPIPDSVKPSPATNETPPEEGAAPGQEQTSPAEAPAAPAEENAPSENESPEKGESSVENETPVEDESAVI